MVTAKERPTPPTCKRCGASEQKDALGYSNIAPALGVCVVCISQAIRPFAPSPPSPSLVRLTNFRNGKWFTNEDAVAVGFGEVAATLAGLRNNVGQWDRISPILPGRWGVDVGRVSSGGVSPAGRGSGQGICRGRVKSVSFPSASQGKRSGRTRRAGGSL